MTESEFRTGRYWDGVITADYIEGRWVSALAREGTKLLHLVFITDNGIVHRTAPLAEVRDLRPLPFKGAAYPVERMVRKFRAIGRERGITEAARAELERASA